MNLIHGFVPSEMFYDDINFPHGFKKSGDFNIAEAELLTSIGKRLHNLEQGISKPENQVEERFITVCKEQLEGETKVEILWQKYKRLTGHIPFHSLHGEI